MQLLGSETAKASLLLSMEQGIVQGWVGLDPLEVASSTVRPKLLQQVLAIVHRAHSDTIALCCHVKCMPATDSPSLDRNDVAVTTAYANAARQACCRVSRACGRRLLASDLRTQLVRGTPLPLSRTSTMICGGHCSTPLRAFVSDYSTMTSFNTMSSNKHLWFCATGGFCRRLSAAVPGPAPADLLQRGGDGVAARGHALRRTVRQVVMMIIAPLLPVPCRPAVAAQMLHLQ